MSSPFSGVPSGHREHWTARAIDAWTLAAQVRRARARRPTVTVSLIGFRRPR
ncbi:hypothetical protein ACFCV8_07400 [Streptomyces sp. NPDC056347]|uniref:hypothetical protein n=1 Tax=Streptomyces sp. NPDC056347 TaxID=3345790 RepID=UPI0035D888A2